MTEQTCACSPEPQSTPRRVRRGEDQGGFIMPWFALMLIVLIAMAGFGVDVWNWWYSGQKQQRAADAGALAGVPFMPLQLSEAKNRAIAEAAKNGYTIAAGDVTVGDKPNQLRVNVTSSVTNSFASLLGVKTTTISRKATAEFNAGVQMGSPNAHFANDPDGGSLDYHWLNIGSPGVDKQTGDRYADYVCPENDSNGSRNVYACSSDKNEEYKDATYYFTIEVKQAGPFDVQIYDPEYAPAGTSCNDSTVDPADVTKTVSRMPTSSQRTALAGQGYANAVNRYLNQSNTFCTGDDNTARPDKRAKNGNGDYFMSNGQWARNSEFTNWEPQATTYVLLAPDSTPFNPADNVPVGGSCSKQFKGYDDANPDPLNTYLYYDLLDTSNAAGKYDATFAASFHRWYTLCSINASGPGKYFLQVRGNVPYGGANPQKGEDPPEKTKIWGQNRFSLRLMSGSSYSTTAAVYAEERLPIYANVGNIDAAGNPKPTFYLARLLPGGGAAGRVLQLQFYDIGDISPQTSAKDTNGNYTASSCAGFSGKDSGCRTTVTILAPTDRSGTAPTCSWTYDDASPIPASASVSGCTLSKIKNSDFNGHLVRVNIAVQGDYSCGSGPLVSGKPSILDTDCWFKINMSYTAGTQANDTTTWGASIGGDPVRLIQ
jgi:Flp pilus assembly protein TadG